MAYENLPGVRVSYTDGNLRTRQANDAPKIVILGTASKGISYELFSAQNARAVEVEFGSDSELAQGVHEAFSQGATNVAVMKIGGERPWLKLTDGTDTLQFSLERREASVLSRYGIRIKDSRLVIYDFTSKQFVYDSESILVNDLGVVEILDTGLLDSLTACYVSNNGASIKDVDQIVSFTVLASGTGFTITGATVKAYSYAGTTGEGMSLNARYAALSRAYHVLDYRDGDFIVPMNVHIDSDNVETSGVSLTGKKFYFNPETGVNNQLGYVWEYEYRGRVYTYFVDSESFAFPSAAASLSADLGTGILTLTARKKGMGPTSSGITVQYAVASPSSSSATASLAATVTKTASSVAILITSTPGDDEGAVYSTAAEIVAFINAHGSVSRWISAAISTGGVCNTAMAATTLTASDAGTSTYVDPTDLHGETIPADVAAKFEDSVAAEYREANFAHQLASFCHHASTTWKAWMGAISFKAPTSYSRQIVSTWLGNLPTYTDLGTELGVASGNNGVGVLGNKFLFGAYGYRSDILTESTSGEGAAYGGLILTTGEDLPNGTSRPYGVKDTDEAVDVNGKPVDIGKFIWVTCDYPVVRNNFVNSPYRAALPVMLCAKYSTMPSNVEAIGDNGRLASISDPIRVHASQVNSLALGRVICLNRIEQFGFILSRSDTAASPNSDYTMPSTMRCLNEMLDTIRTIARPFVSNAFNDETIGALQGAIDGYLRSVQNKLHRGARAQINVNARDRILGRMKIGLRSVPVSTLRFIDVETSLASDESEL